MLDFQSSNDQQGSEDRPFPKWMLAGVLFFSFLTLIVVVKQMQGNLEFEIPILGSGVETPTQETGVLSKTDEELKAQDSDRDGLNDFEELKVYGTSPFISDTDSDGASDKEEVDAGEDPNCPDGQVCYGPAVVSEGKLQPQINQYQSPEIQALVQDPDALREILIQTGADPLIVNSLDDQTLQLVAQEAFTSLTAPTADKLELLADLEADSVRQLMINAGVDPTLLAELSDEELLAVYKEALESQSGGL